MRAVCEICEVTLGKRAFKSLVSTVIFEVVNSMVIFETDYGEDTNAMGNL